MFQFEMLTIALWVNLGLLLLAVLGLVVGLVFRYMRDHKGIPSSSKKAEPAKLQIIYPSTTTKRRSEDPVFLGNSLNPQMHQGV